MDTELCRQLSRSERQARVSLEASRDAEERRSREFANELSATESAIEGMRLNVASRMEYSKKGRYSAASAATRASAETFALDDVDGGGGADAAASPEDGYDAESFDSMSASEHGSDLDVLLRDVYDEFVSPRPKPVSAAARTAVPPAAAASVPAQPHYGTPADRVRAAHQERHTEQQARIAAELSANQHRSALEKLQRELDEKQRALTHERDALAAANAQTAAAKDEAARAKKAASAANELISEEAAELVSDFLCPILGEIMEDPVICEDGHSYDRASIEHWFQSCASDGRPPTSPKTNARLSSTRLIPNITLRGAIEDYQRAVEKLRSTLHEAPPPTPTGKGGGIGSDNSIIGGDTGGADSARDGRADAPSSPTRAVDLQAEPGAAAWSQRRSSRAAAPALAAAAAARQRPVAGFAARAVPPAATASDVAADRTGPYRPVEFSHLEYLLRAIKYAINRTITTENLG